MIIPDSREVYWAYHKAQLCERFQCSVPTPVHTTCLMLRANAVSADKCPGTQETHLKEVPA